MKQWNKPVIEDLNVRMTAGEDTGTHGDNRFNAIVDGDGKVVSVDPDSEGKYTPVDPDDFS